MSVTFVPAGTPRRDPARVCILGDPGAGKSRMAATFPHPLFADLENGASSALADGAPARVIIPTDAGALSNVRALIKKLTKKPDENGLVEYEGVGVGTLVVDSFDAIQQTVKMFTILKGRRTKMEGEDWDEMLNATIPLILEMNALPINLVVTAHTKRVEGRKGQPGTMGFSMQGAMRYQFPRWFSLILHIVSGVDGARFVVTQPMISKGYRYTAKDRHSTLRSMVQKNWIPLVDNDGYPNDEIAKAICG